MSVMYLTAIGYGMVAAGIFIDFADEYDDEDNKIPDYIKLLFAGGFLTTLFWVRDTIQHTCSYKWFSVIVTDSSDHMPLQISL